jgi:hypothetical protein
MVEPQYGLIEVNKPEFPPRDLWVVPTANGPLVTSVFGPNAFNENVAEMQREYTHPQTGENISFREPATQESLEACAYCFEEMVKPKILEPSWLQLGRLVKTSDGIFTNTTETNKSKLDRMLNSVIEDKGIYFVNDSIVFIPYDSFEECVLSGDDFARTTLARGLEHTKQDVASNVAKISAKRFYSGGVNVFCWKEAGITQPIQRLSAVSDYSGRLNFDGGDWIGDYDGRAFGVKK